MEIQLKPRGQTSASNRLEIHTDGREKLQLWQVGSAAALWGHAFIWRVCTQLLANPFQRRSRPVSLTVQTNHRIPFQSLPMCCMSHWSSPYTHFPAKIIFMETSQTSHSSFMSLLFFRGATPLLLILQILIIVCVISSISTLAITARSMSPLESKPCPHCHPCKHQILKAAEQLSIQ